MTEFYALTLTIAVLLLLLCAWYLYDSRHNDSDVVTSPKVKRKTKDSTSKVVLEDDEEKHLKDFLQQIYDSGTLFTLSISKKKPKKYMGLYYPDRQNITVYSGWCSCDEDLKEIAIHEYAHHIYYTRLGYKKGQVHNQQFWQIYSALVAKAAEKNLYLPHSMPILIEIMKMA